MIINLKKKLLINYVKQWRNKLWKCGLQEILMENYGLLQYFIETHSDDTDLSDICEQCGDSVITFKKTL